MQLPRLLVTATFLGYGSFLFGADPAYQFKMNDDARSFVFTLSNETGQDIECKKISIDARVSGDDCNGTVAVYHFSEKAIRLKPDAKLVNPNFGIDFLQHTRKTFKISSLTFCDVPKIEFECQ